MKKRRFKLWACALFIALLAAGSVYAALTYNYTSVRCNPGVNTVLTAQVAKTDASYPGFTISDFTPKISTAGNWEPRLEVGLYVSSTGTCVLSTASMNSTGSYTFTVDDLENAIGCKRNIYALI